MARMGAGVWYDTIMSFLIKYLEVMLLAIRTIGIWEVPRVSSAKVMSLPSFMTLHYHIPPFPPPPFFPLLWGKGQEICHQSGQLGMSSYVKLSCSEQNYFSAAWEGTRPLPSVCLANGTWTTVSMVKHTAKVWRHESKPFLQLCFYQFVCVTLCFSHLKTKVNISKQFANARNLQICFSVHRAFTPITKAKETQIQSQQTLEVVFMIHSTVL